MFDLNYSRYGAYSILIEWPQEINENILYDIIRFKKRIKQESLKEKLQVINGYNSLLIFYDLDIENFYDKVDLLKNIYYTLTDDIKYNRKVWQIPVCYSEKVVEDLSTYAKQKKLDITEIIALHTASKYTMYFTGFLPGFLYLGGLDEKLFIDRKEIPSLKIKPGTVAIGGKQTGIYPIESPGGWYGIGRTPLRFFDVQLEKPTFIEAGDQIQFYSVDEKEYNAISADVELRKYKPEYKIIDGRS
ncbi:5-oxoprolinase subunit PxpB [Aquimarina rhabdastrellae]